MNKVWKYQHEWDEGECYEVCATEEIAWRRLEEVLRGYDGLKEELAEVEDFRDGGLWGVEALKFIKE